MTKNTVVDKFQNNANAFEKLSKEDFIHADFEQFKKPAWNNDSERLVKDDVSPNKLSLKLSFEAFESMKAQIKMNVKRNVIPETEGKQLIDSLDKIYKEVQQIKPPELSTSIYGYIEKRVSEIAPEAYGWFKVARSLHSQKSGDIIFWARGALSRLDLELEKLQTNLLEKAENFVKSVFPGRVHGQLTQPISFGHYLMGYVEIFARHRSRVKNAIDNMHLSPYSCAEISGTSFPVSADMVAKHVNFAKSHSNSVDAISSRDFVIEALCVMTNTSITLSKYGRDMHRWHSSDCGYIAFSTHNVDQHDAAPFKRDPRKLEVALAGCASAIGCLVSASTISSSFGLEYSEEMDKISEYLIASYEDLINSLKVISELTSDFTVNTKAMKEAAYKNFSVAIDLVDWVIQNSKCNYYDAQKRVRSLIDFAISKGKKLSLLELSEIKQYIPEADENIYSVLIPSRAIITRRSQGGSNPVQVRKAIRVAKRKKHH